MWAELPPEILHRILVSLNYDDLRAMTCVCLLLKTVLLDSRTWIHLLEHRGVIPSTDYRQQYLNLPEHDGQEIALIHNSTITKIATIANIIDLSLTNSTIEVLTPRSYRRYHHGTMFYIPLPRRYCRLRHGYLQDGPGSLYQLDNLMSVPHIATIDNINYHIYHPQLLKVGFCHSDLCYLTIDGTMRILRSSQLHKQSVRHRDHFEIHLKPSSSFLDRSVADFAVSGPWLALTYRSGRTKILRRNNQQFTVRHILAGVTEYYFTTNSHYYRRDDLIYKLTGADHVPLPGLKVRRLGGVDNNQLLVIL